MANILNIETSSKFCSVAVSSSNKIIGSIAAKETFTHTRDLTSLIEELLKQCDMELNDLQAIAVNSGPGSYTALRVGYSVAKGLCFGLDIKMLAHSAFEILVQQSMESEGDQVYDCILPMIDARRDEVYMATYDSDGSMLINPHSFILDEEALKKTISTKKNILIIGDATEKAKFQLKGAEFHVIQVEMEAAQMGALSWSKYQAGSFENVAYTIPFYLKPPNIVASKKKYF